MHSKLIAYYNASTSNDIAYHRIMALHAHIITIKFVVFIALFNNSLYIDVYSALLHLALVLCS